MRINHLPKQLKKISLSKAWHKILFITMGITSTIWFLIRVIPKPTRATYPCMRAAAPFMSSFVIYLLSIGGASALLKKFPKGFKKAQVGLTIAFFVLALTLPGISNSMKEQAKISAGSPREAANTPMGEAKGIFPGRVVWVHNPDATDENLPTDWSGKATDHFKDKYTNQEEVDKMLEAAVKTFTEKETIKESWDDIFKFFNEKQGKGNVAYQAGEIIYLKVNRTSSWGGNFRNNDLSRVENNYHGVCETSPQLVTSVLRHLVNEIGVAQEDIYIGDPMKHLYKEDYDKWHGEFPDVVYLDVDRSTNGRTRVTKSNTAIIDYSDRGEILRSGDPGMSDAKAGDPIQTDYLYTIYEEMDYMINIPTMKAHDRGGVTMFAKNHFGSHTRSDAKHLHGGLTRIGDMHEMRNQYGMYRVLVDIMGHELLGEKNLIYLMDALYGSETEVTQPNKFSSYPWDGDWTSSIFLSQDPVAIESVGFDILQNEYDGSNDYRSCPNYGAVDDYLHQAADDENWPEDIVYDPENDGTPLKSLGVHEHWNNPTDMQYSRNLGAGNGIELVRVTPDYFNPSGFKNLPELVNDLKIYPNPVQNEASMSFYMSENGFVKAEIYSLEGRKFKCIVDRNIDKGEYSFPIDAFDLKKGIYLMRISVTSQKGTSASTIKFEKR